MQLYQKHCLLASDFVSANDDQTVMQAVVLSQTALHLTTKECTTASEHKNVDLNAAAACHSIVQVMPCNLSCFKLNLTFSKPGTLLKTVDLEPIRCYYCLQQDDRNEWNSLYLAI